MSAMHHDNREAGTSRMVSVSLLKGNVASAREHRRNEAHVSNLGTPTHRHGLTHALGVMGHRIRAFSGGLREIDMISLHKALMQISHCCYGLNVCVSPKFICWKANAQGDSIRRREWALGGDKVTKVEPTWMELVPLCKGLHRGPLPVGLLPLLGHDKKSTV